jgi:phenylpropionate dioxygenase-like ring-hydroxylating dioxygenase large terminal subunit
VVGHILHSSILVPYHGWYYDLLPMLHIPASFCRELPLMLKKGSV